MLDPAVIVVELIAALLGIGAAGYLLYALIHPDRF